ncbi:MAG TPA: hypothetical protein VD948_08785 [Rhodothermales bacterium]|nr:hypothetical protein [Rhodothermales bacterium]
MADKYRDEAHLLTQERDAAVEKIAALERDLADTLNTLARVVGGYERLRAENERLREALEWIEKHFRGNGCWACEQKTAKARAALAPEAPKEDANG